jgi:hypothetical protein
MGARKSRDHNEIRHVHESIVRHQPPFTELIRPRRAGEVLQHTSCGACPTDAPHTTSRSRRRAEMWPRKAISLGAGERIRTADLFLGKKRTRPVSFAKTRQRRATARPDGHACRPSCPHLPHAGAQISPIGLPRRSVTTAAWIDIPPEVRAPLGQRRHRLLDATP